MQVELVKNFVRSLSDEMWEFYIVHTAHSREFVDETMKQRVDEFLQLFPMKAKIYRFSFDVNWECADNLRVDLFVEFDLEHQFEACFNVLFNQNISLTDE